MANSRSARERLLREFTSDNVASQVARTTHRYTYNSLLTQVGSLKEVPKLKSVRRSQPIVGVVELNATLIFKERIRAHVARFEGVDHKWLCTELSLI